jgi:hypothetical protein
LTRGIIVFGNGVGDAGQKYMPTTQEVLTSVLQGFNCGQAVVRHALYSVQEKFTQLQVINTVNNKFVMKLPKS